MNPRDDEELGAPDIFLDAVLERVHRPDEIARKRRIEVALAATVREGVRPAPARSTPWRPWIVVAACVMAAVVIFFPWEEAEPTALAAIQRTIEVMDIPEDRQYDVEVIRFENPIKPLEGKLFVRGAERLTILLRRFGGEFWVGEGAESSWIVRGPRHAPVIVRPLGFVRKHLATGEVDQSLPFLDISRFLSQARDHYDLSIEEQDADRLVLSAVLRDRGASVRFPDEIEIETDARGVVTRMYRRWSRQEGNRYAEIRLTLRGEDAVDDSFYEHQRLSAGRRIVDFR